MRESQRGNEKLDYLFIACRKIIGIYRSFDNIHVVVLLDPPDELLLSSPAFLMMSEFNSALNFHTFVLEV